MKQQSRKRTFNWLIVIPIIVILGVIAAAITAVTLDKPKQPNNLTELGAFHIVDNSSNENATRVDIFLDPLCPGCAQVEMQLSETLKTLSENKEIDLYVTPIAFLDEASQNNYSTMAVNALTTVYENSPEKFMDFLTIMMENQPAENSEDVSTVDSLKIMADTVGVPESTFNKFSDETYNKWIADHTAKQMTRKDIFPDGLIIPAVFLNSKIENNEVVEYKLVEFNNIETILEDFILAYEEVKTK